MKGTPMIAKFKNVRSFLSDELTPIHVLFVLAIAVLLTDPELESLSTNIPTTYSSYTKALIRNLNLLFLLLMSVKRFAHGALRAATVLLIVAPAAYFLEFLSPKATRLLLIPLMLWIVRPNGVHLFLLPPAASFIAGLKNSPELWEKDDIELFLSYPYILLLCRTDRDKWRELSVVLLVMFFSLFSRTIGMICGTLFLTARRIYHVFPSTSYFSSAALTFVGFTVGYAYFLEFQKGIPIEEPLRFISRLHIPVYLSFAYPLFSLTAFLVRRVSQKFLNRTKAIF